MNTANEIFRHKKLIPQKLEPYGFIPDGDGFLYRQSLKKSGFWMSVRITPQGQVTATVVDPSFDDVYSLHLTEEATGSFVGGVRTEYETVLSDIAEHCFEPEIFQSFQTQQLIAYVRQTYGDELEYLWEKFPCNAVWRRKDNRKWYAAVLTVSKRKLGMKSDEIAEIIDLREEPEEVSKLVNDKTYFRGWHMNKKHWYTVILDGSVPVETLFEQIDRSYRLALK